jgi:hypothetical protein
MADSKVTPATELEDKALEHVAGGTYRRERKSVSNSPDFEPGQVGTMKPMSQKDSVD